MENHFVRRGIIALAAALGLFARDVAPPVVAKRKRKKSPSTVWAVVGGGASPVIVRDKGAESVTRLGVGSVAVSFSREVSRCAYTVTLFSGNGFVYASNLDGFPTQVTVRTSRTDAIPVDSDFSLVVNC
jgi:hypothetical protein